MIKNSNKIIDGENVEKILSREISRVQNVLHQYVYCDHKPSYG